MEIEKIIKLRTLDFETTGLFEENRPDPEVIEIGFTDIELIKNKDETFEEPFITNEFVSYVRSEVLVTHKARAVHHIPQTVIDAAPIGQEQYRGLIEGTDKEWKPDIFVAHNAEFEKKFFNPEGSFWVCTFKCARRIWPDFEQHTNQYIRYRLGLDERESFETHKAMPPHAALPDTYTTAFILMEMLKVASIVELIKFTRMPIHYATVPIGKHRGQKWAEVPSPYLDWMSKNIKEDDILAAVKEEQTNRRG